MSIIVLVLGLVITGAGAVAIGFGIPVSDLGLRHTLITAGTTAFAGGLILVGLAAAVAELTKIADAVRPPRPSRPGRPADTKSRVEAPPAPVPSLVPTPPPAPREGRIELRTAEPTKFEARPFEIRPPEPTPVVPPPEARTPEVRPTEPRLGGDSSLEFSASAIERLRSSLPRNERPKADVRADIVDEVPLSPKGANGTNGSSNGVNGAYHHASEPLVESKVGGETKPLNGSVQPDASGETPKAPRLDFLFRSKSGRAGQPETFDALWPKRPSKGKEPPRPVSPTPPERPAVSEAPVAPERSVATEHSESTEEPVDSVTAPTPTPVPTPAPVVAQVLQASETRTVGILKSGVVDGMAYTLYSDGSIEAQLPQGTVRFGSIAELRAHIENNP